VGLVLVHLGVLGIRREQAVLLAQELLARQLLGKGGELVRIDCAP
jgi:hypothetical protein